MKAKKRGVGGRIIPGVTTRLEAYIIAWENRIVRRECDKCTKVTSTKPQ